MWQLPCSAPKEPELLAGEVLETREQLQIIAHPPATCQSKCSADAVGKRSSEPAALMPSDVETFPKTKFISTVLLRNCPITAGFHL